jgi:hypothetical protein
LNIIEEEDVDEDDEFDICDFFLCEEDVTSNG